jgi:septal ring factor EnvC (AmiA/AmiB activator)
MNDSGDITAKFTATERAIDKLQQPTIEIERTRNAIRETEKRNEGVRAELEAIQKRIKKGYKAIRESSDEQQRIAEAQKEISRLGGLIAWQDNRSKQFKTIIERGY